MSELCRRGMSEGEANLYAAAHARDMQDFAKHVDNNIIQILTQTVPFTKASIQGLEKMVRSGPTQKIVCHRRTDPAKDS